MNKEDLKIAFFSSYDKTGGAAIACYNATQSLRDNGYNAIEVVRVKTCNAPFVYPVHVNRGRSYFQRAIDKFFPKQPYRDVKEDTDSEYRFFGDDSESPDMCTIEEIEASLPFIPNVVFVGHTFRLVNTRILAELHQRWGCHIFLSCTDINPYTAGCHVHWDCKGYTTGCKDCPAVLVESRKKEVAEAFEKKRQNIINGKIGIRYSNKWLERELRESLMFKDLNCVFTGQNTNTDLYHNKNRDIAKRIFGIPSHAKVLMNGSTALDDKRKGLDYFCKAMNILWDNMSQEERENTHIVIVGKNRNSVQPLLDTLPKFKVLFLEYITDNRYLSLLYQATDVYVGTSLEDAGPMMVSDSLACGTPVVGFETGLIADEDIIRNGETGYSVPLRDSESLALRIKDVLSLCDRDFATMSNNCRKVAEDILSYKKTIERLSKLFDEL